MARRDVPRWLPALLLVGAVLTLFHRLLSRHTLFWGLPSLQFYPWRSFAFEQIGQGILPGWNPYNGAGAPLLANYQSAIFYPPNWLHAVLPGPLAMNVGVLLHLALAGIGMWGFTGALGLTTFGRSVSTLAYALSGYLIGRAGSFATFDAAIWIPWVFWLVQRVLTTRAARDAGLLALVVGLQLLAGHAQTTWYGAVGVGLYVAWSVASGPRHRPLRARVAVLPLLAGAVLLGAGIAAVQLIPTAGYLAQSPRAGGLDFDFTANLSYELPRLITLLSPNFYGTPADGSYLTQGIYFEDHAYVGFLPLLLAVNAIVGWIGRRRLIADHPRYASVPFWALLALGALLIAMGRHGPVFRFLYEYVPTFDAFREPVRWLILTTFSLAVLAGIGTENWQRGRWVTFWSRLAVAGGGAMALLALAAPEVTAPSRNLTVLSRGIAVLGCWIVASALLTLARPLDAPADHRALRRWQAAALLFVALDLAWAGAGLNPTVPTGFYRDFGVARPPGRIYWFQDYEDAVKYQELFTLKDYTRARDRWPEVRASLLPNLNLLDRVPALNNFDPLLPAHHRRYLDLIEALGPRAAPLLAAAGVSQTYGDTRPDGWQGEPPLFVAPGPAPRYWLVGHAEWAASDAEIEDLLRRPSWDPYATVILAGKPPDAVPDAPGAAPAGDVVVLEERSNRVVLRARTEAPAYLVISATWYPGWRAEIDGQRVPLYRANLAFQAVAIPAGGADVMLSFRPQGILAGAGISVLALTLTLALIALSAFGVRLPWRRDDPPPPLP